MAADRNFPADPRLDGETACRGVGGMDFAPHAGVKVSPAALLPTQIVFVSRRENRVALAERRDGGAERSATSTVGLSLMVVRIARREVARRVFP